MEIRDVDRVKYLIEKLRDITLAAQIIPFAYSALYILCMVIYLTASDNVLGAVDSLFYVSPVIVISFLIESRILKLCKWHKRACCIPLIPQVVVFADWFVIDIDRTAAYIAIATPAVMCILLLIAAWNVFLKPKHNGRKEKLA